MMKCLICSIVFSVLYSSCHYILGEISGDHESLFDILKHGIISFLLWFTITCVLLKDWYRPSE